MNVRIWFPGTMKLSSDNFKEGILRVDKQGHLIIEHNLTPYVVGVGMDNEGRFFQTQFYPPNRGSTLEA